MDHDPASWNAGELDAVAAAMDGLTRGVGRGMAERRLAADPGPVWADHAPIFTREELGDVWGTASARPSPGAAPPDRLVRFPGDVWDQVNGLPDPPRGTVRQTISSLFDEPVPAAASRFSADPAAYELRVPADDVTIWYSVTGNQGRDVISVLLTSGRGVEDDTIDDE